MEERMVETSAARRGPRVRFGLRGAFVGMTLSAVLFALFARPIAEQRRRERLLSEVLKLGGIYKAVYPHPVAPSFGQQLLTLFDSSYDDLYLYEVGLAHTRVTDADVRRLAELDAIMSLDLEGTGVTDEAMPALARLRRIGKLNLNGTRVTDRGVTELSAAKNLLMLRVVGTAVTYSALEKLDGLQGNTNFCEQRALEELHGAGYQVLDAYLNAEPPFGVGDSPRGAATIIGGRQWKRLTQADVKKLNYLDSLVDLTLHNVQLEPPGLTALERLPNLRKLKILLTDADDDDLAAIARQTQMRQLMIHDCQNVSEAGLRELTKLSELQFLEVRGCERISKEAMARVAERLPECQWRYFEK